MVVTFSQIWENLLHFQFNKNHFILLKYSKTSKQNCNSQQTFSSRLNLEVYYSLFLQFFEIFLGESRTSNGNWWYCGEWFPKLNRAREKFRIEKFCSSIPRVSKKKCWVTCKYFFWWIFSCVQILPHMIFIC